MMMMKRLIVMTTGALALAGAVSACHADPARSSQVADCPAVAIPRDALAAGDTRWQSFDFWVDRMRRGLARPADAGDLSRIGGFCGSWSVLLRRLGSNQPGGRLTLIVTPDGDYAAVIRDNLTPDTGGFHFDRGKLAASEGGLRFTSALGWNDEGLWLARAGDGPVAMLQQQVLEFRPLGPNARRQFARMLAAADKSGPCRPSPSCECTAARELVLTWQRQPSKAVDRPFLKSITWSGARPRASTGYHPAPMD